MYYTVTKGNLPLCAACKSHHNVQGELVSMEWRHIAWAMMVEFAKMAEADVTLRTMRFTKRDHFPKPRTYSLEQSFVQPLIFEELQLASRMHDMLRTDHDGARSVAKSDEMGWYKEGTGLLHFLQQTDLAYFQTTMEVPTSDDVDLAAGAYDAASGVDAGAATAATAAASGADTVAAAGADAAASGADATATAGADAAASGADATAGAGADAAASGVDATAGAGADAATAGADAATAGAAATAAADVAAAADAADADARARYGQRKRPASSPPLPPPPKPKKAKVTTTGKLLPAYIECDFSSLPFSFLLFPS